ncbi:MAG TPA: carboxypeptidase-like regulatory domain-containing protein [Terriglobales bacterium]|nr:carboxypeptidase-like regulatory domain-containing protein [Terriglobales bacterium]
MKRKKKPKTATTPNQASFAVCVSILACLTICLISTTTLQAQRAKSADYALIFGTVWGPDDRPVYGVTVKIRKAGEKRTRWEIHSNHLGEFEQRVPAGKQDYVLSADLSGYKSPEFKHLQPGPEITVHVENDERVDTGLHLK